VGVVDFPSESEASTAKHVFSGFNPHDDGNPGIELSEQPPPSMQQRQPSADPRAAKRQRPETPQNEAEQQQQQQQGSFLLDALTSNLSGVDPNTLSQSFSVLQNMVQQQPQQPQAQQQPAQPPPQAPPPQPPPQAPLQAPPQVQQQSQPQTQPQGGGTQIAQPPVTVQQPSAGVGQSQLGGHLMFNVAPGSMDGAVGLPLPADAIQTLFVEGVPKDCTQREVNHVFRPFHGFQSARLVLHSSKQRPGEQTMLCFAEFENAQLATLCMYCLQGYVFDRDDPESNKLRLSYAKTKSSDRHDHVPQQQHYIRGRGRGGRARGTHSEESEQRGRHRESSRQRDGY
jgi:hypothetical protein